MERGDRDTSGYNLTAKLLGSKNMVSAGPWRNYYGGNWASFSFSGLLFWIKENQQKTNLSDKCEDWRKMILEDEEAIPLSSKDKTIHHVEDFCFGDQDSAEGVEEAGALPKLPVFAAAAAQGVSPGPEESPAAEGISLGSEESPAAEGVSPGPEKEDPAVESPGEEAQSPEPEQAPGTDPAGAGTAPGSGAAPGRAPGESPPEPAKAEPAPSENAAQEPKKITYSQIVREGRRFNIDLVSKLLYSQGLLIDLLIKSNVSRYAEFKNATRVL
ncbi:hypothetical protein HGM15179_019584, partial [Zosterops borbonicus]